MPYWPDFASIELQKVCVEEWAQSTMTGLKTHQLRNCLLETSLIASIKTSSKWFHMKFKNSIQLHDNILLETQLTQSIIRECDTASYCTPGHVRHFQVDPFGAHLYMETGISILVNKLKQKSPVALYLDATGSVISQIPHKKTSYTTH